MKKTKKKKKELLHDIRKPRYVQLPVPRSESIPRMYPKKIIPPLDMLIYCTAWIEVIADHRD